MGSTAILYYASALHPTKDLVLLHGSKDFQFAIHQLIYTLEGYYVTSLELHSGHLLPDSVLFSEDIMAISGTQCGLILSNDYNIRRVHHPEYIGSTLDSDDYGTVYANHSYNQIGVYTPDLEYESIFEGYNGIYGAIVSLCIKGHDMYVLSDGTRYSRRSHLFQINLETRDLVKTTTVGLRDLGKPSNMSLDQFNNVCISGLCCEKIGVWYEGGNVHYHQIRNLSKISKKCVKISIIHDSRLVCLYSPGFIRIYYLL